MTRLSLIFLFIFIFTISKGQSIGLRPALPLFLRAGDGIELATEILNTTDTERTGQVQLELIDASTGQSVDGWFMNTFPNQYFTVAAGSRETVRFPVQIPVRFYGRLLWKLSASTGSDAHALRDTSSGAVSVLNDRTLHTEDLALMVKHTGLMAFRFDPLLKIGNRESLQHHALTAEYITDPRWFFADALPMLTDAQPDDAGQAWIAYFARSLALSILHQSGNGAQRSPLDSALLRHRVFPEDDPARLSRLPLAEGAMAYDLAGLEEGSRKSLRRLALMQLPDGSFPWMRNGSSDNNVTVTVLAGIGLLEQLAAVSSLDRDSLEALKRRALRYMDGEFALGISKDSSNVIPYLYVRSFFGASEITSATRIAIDRQLRSAVQKWKELPKAMQAMLSAVLWRSGDRKLATTILTAAAQGSVSGSNDGLWWQQPVEIRSLLVRAAAECGSPLLKNQVSLLVSMREGLGWGTPQATASACTALLMAMKTGVHPAGPVILRLGMQEWKEPVTASGRYFWTVPSRLIDSALGRGALTTLDSGGLFHLSWSYFDEAQKESAGPLRIEKSIFRQQAKGISKPLSDGDEVRAGETLTVQLRLFAVRALDYIEVSDGWASMLESADAGSSVYTGTGQSYYRMIGSEGMRFYFRRLAKGGYVISYRLRVVRAGGSSQARALIQAVHAPMLRAYSMERRLTAVE